MHVQVDSAIRTDARSRYVREKRARKLQDCENKIKATEEQVSKQNDELEALRKVIADVEREINEGGAVLANLRDNMRVRKLRAEITSIEAELNSMDLDEAAKAKRNFEQKYPAEQKKEQDLAGQVCSSRARVDLMDRH